MKPIHSVSVRNIVEFILRRGDIDAKTAQASSDMVLGTKIHKMIQKREEKSGNYTSEVRLFHVFEFEEIDIKVQGIADGIIIDPESGKTTVDEIKSTSFPLDRIDAEFSFLHQSQADFYAYFLCVKKGLDEIFTRITYCDVETHEIRYIHSEKKAAELYDFVFAVVSDYAKWAYWKSEFIAERNASIKELSFPFPNFRAGQREVAGSVYQAVRQKSTLFTQAPTGIGKTVSALFPTIKAIGEGFTEKIFYLTAKNISRAVAENALFLMKEKNLKIRSVTITSKEKVCNYQKQCNPTACPFAKGHFDRINNAIFDIITAEDIITYEKITEYSNKHMVCPFEFTLDVSMWCDVIICDYNYAFDPRASLKRYFDQGGEYVLLCDEAHNLADRGREMFSAIINKRAVMKATVSLKNVSPICVKSLKKINKMLIEYKKHADESNYDKNIIIEKPEELYREVFAYCDLYSKFLGEEGNEFEKNETIDLFFDCLTFIFVYEDLGDEYLCYASNAKGDTQVKLFCVNPARLLSETCDKCRAVIYFSATLLPKEYYIKMLGGKSADTKDGEIPRFIRLPSPFPRENLMISIFATVSTRYRDREKSYQNISEIIKITSQKKGNYIAFFPSFAYMNKVYEEFCVKYPETQTILQKTEMNETEREEFLLRFVENPKETLIGFAVMGGVFSEGVDLVGTRLSGAIIVGTGLPQVCFERDLIKRHFDEFDEKGFAYSYEYPGFTRVLQAAGRVIRTETDKGVIILVDDRYRRKDYREMFPPEWFGDGFEYIFSKEALDEKISSFWENQSEINS